MCIWHKPSWGTPNPHCSYRFCCMHNTEVTGTLHKANSSLLIPWYCFCLSEHNLKQQMSHLWFASCSSNCCYSRYRLGIRKRFFPLLNNGSHCSYYTEALSLASPLFRNHIPASPLSAPSSWAQHLLTGQLEWLTHHRLGSTQLACVCVSLRLCISRLPLRIFINCVEVDFFMCMCVLQISVVCVLCGLGGLTTQTEWWDRMHRWSQEWTAPPCQSVEQERRRHTHTHTRIAEAVDKEEKQKKRGIWEVEREHRERDFIWK